MAWSLVVALVFGYAISTAVYRLYLHPLARYPGPFWARLTTIPSYLHTLRGDRHIWLWQLQEEYGPTFRYRPDSVLINTPTAYKTLFGPKGNVKKGLYYEAWPRNVDAVNTWNTRSLQVHGRKRRVLNYAFSDKALRSAEPFVVSNADRWCEVIAGEMTGAGTGWSESLNMADWVNYLVFDILGDLCFGKSFNMKEPSSDMKYVPHLMTEFLALMHPIAFSPFASLWVWLKPRGLDKLISLASPPALKNWQAFVERCLADRTEMEEQQQHQGDDEKREEKEEEEEEEEEEGEKRGRKDFFHYLFHATDPETGERGFPLDELYGECELLIIAGSDTTAIVLSALFFYLARRPDAQARLAREVRSAFAGASGSGDIRAGGPALRSCRYLRAAIQEALRMTPPVAAEPSREVLGGGTVVDGHFFPPGVHVSTGLYCLSYNKDVYPDPFAFRPERWIVSDDDDDEESVALAESGFCAFSYGSRGCPGKNLAWMEMSVVMAKVIFEFEIRQDASNLTGGGSPGGKFGRENVDQYQTYDAFVSLRDGPMVQFKKRPRGPSV